MQGRDVIHYVDNEAARLSAIKGSSPSRSSAWLIQALWETEVMNESKSWFSRVPTECNIGDGPSREDWKEVERIYPKQTKTVWTQIQEMGLMKRWRRTLSRWMPRARTNSFIKVKKWSIAG